MYLETETEREREESKGLAGRGAVGSGENTVSGGGHPEGLMEVLELVGLVGHPYIRLDSHFAIPEFLIEWKRVRVCCVCVCGLWRGSDGMRTPGEGGRQKKNMRFNFFVLVFVLLRFFLVECYWFQSVCARACVCEFFFFFGRGGWGW